ncbi:2Fe-2S iron-sulfur cluster binding domain-containing protein [Streptomyces virginiae]|uniref:2Fe-2S iron-sulfur cluster-binding protein n=1 Tax=Streptomyces virginiae TaxID=1961 RepID=UPI00224FEB92|nr:2Fe-2S iron-sulfur cluster binding domain-containing protein [Streptomyces virginiae]MCX4720313.1 2Fe-2S iron-sulfur cluster binding domain-containing protein [Streptomyces virginiae]
MELDGTVHSVPWAAGTPLLDGPSAAGLPAPYSCREGMARNEVLDETDLAEGHILARQALPLGPTVRIT